MASSHETQYWSDEPALPNPPQTPENENEEAAAPIPPKAGRVAADEDEIAKAIHENFTSPNVLDSNGEAANVVDALTAIAQAITRLTEAVTTRSTPPGQETSADPLDGAGDVLSRWMSGIVASYRVRK
jgi:hypothetical protein